MADQVADRAGPTLYMRLQRVNGGVGSSDSMGIVVTLRLMLVPAITLVMVGVCGCGRGHASALCWRNSCGGGSGGGAGARDSAQQRHGTYQCGSWGSIVCATMGAGVCGQDKRLHEGLILSSNT